MEGKEHKVLAWVTMRENRLSISYLPRWMVLKEIKVLLYLLLLIFQKFLIRPFLDQEDSIDRLELDSQMPREEPEFLVFIQKIKSLVQMSSSKISPKDASVCPELILPTS